MNKNVFITGGTSGIGKSLIFKFSENKYNIFFTYYKNFREAKLISNYLKKKSINHSFVKMDLNKIDSINNAFKIFSRKFNKINVFINNATPSIKRSNFLKLNDKRIKTNFEELLIGNLLSIKKAANLILKNKSKSTIVNISSYAAISGGKDIHLYAASKAAMKTIITALSKDLFKNKIKIFSILPKHINTPTFRRNNNIKTDDGTLLNDVLKQIRGLLKKKVTNPTAKEWVRMEMKRRNITRAPKGW